MARIKKHCSFVVYTGDSRGRGSSRVFPVSNAGWEKAVAARGHAIGLRCSPGPGGDEGSTATILLARDGKVTRPNLSEGDYGYDFKLAGAKRRKRRR